MTEKIDEILHPFLQDIGKDIGYVNHTKRMLAYALELENLDQEQIEKFIIALAFHDLGIWTEKSFDYLRPSISLAETYLNEHNLNPYKDEIIQMIDEHHKLSPITNSDLAELFRKVDMIDVYWGLITFGISKDKIREIKQKYPNNGFHLTLLKWFSKRLLSKPWSPMPMLKW